MSVERAKDVLKLAGMTFDALKVIQDLTHIGGDKANDVLQTIAQIAASLREGLAGKTTPDIVEAEVKAFASRILTDDALIDLELRTKFHKE